MKKWKLWMGILLIFLAGICIGGFGTGLYIRHTVLSTLNGGSPVIAERISKRLARRLDLSSAQQTVTGKILRETQFRLQQLRRQHLPEAELIITDGIGQINKELTPQQQEKLQALYNRFKERWIMKGENQNNAL